MSGRGRSPGRGGNKGGNRWNNYNNQKGRSPSSRGSSPSRGQRSGGNRSTSNSSGGDKNQGGGRGGGRNFPGRPPLNHSKGKNKGGRNSGGGSVSAPTSPTKRSDQESKGTVTSNRKGRRPKFLDNPSAPEIVEKRALKTPPILTSPSASKSAEASAKAAKEDEGDKKESTNGHHDATDGPEEDMKDTKSDDTNSKDEVKNNGVEEEVSGVVKDIVSKVDGDTTPKENLDLEDMINDSEVVLESEESKVLENGTAPPVSDLAEALLTELNKQALEKAEVSEEDLMKVLKSSVHKVLTSMPAENSASSTSSSKSNGNHPCVLTEESRGPLETVIRDFISGKTASPSKEGKETDSSHISFPPSITMQSDRIVKELMDSLKEEEKEEKSSDDPTSADEKPPGANPSSTEIVTLDKLSAGMVPLSDPSVQIQDISVKSVDNALGGANPGEEASFVIQELEFAEVAGASPKPPSLKLADKSRLFSQMEDKFAKETHNALKNKPVYKKRAGAAQGSPNKLSESRPKGDQVKSEDNSSPIEDGTSKEEEVVEELKPEKAGEEREKIDDAESKSLSDTKILLIKEPGEVPPDLPTVASETPSASPPPLAVEAMEADVNDDEKSGQDNKENLGEEGLSSNLKDGTAEDITQVEAMDDKPPSLECQVPPSSGVMSDSNKSDNEGSPQKSSSELTKSLRKVRVRKSRNSSSNGGTHPENEGTPPPPILTISASELSDADSNSVTSPNRIIRPCLLPSSSSTESVANSKGSKPLQIEIPDEELSPLPQELPESLSNMSDCESGPAASSKLHPQAQNLLMKPAANPKSDFHRVKETVLIFDSVISKTDAIACVSACFSGLEEARAKIPSLGQPKTTKATGSRVNGHPGPGRPKKQATTPNPAVITPSLSSAKTISPSAAVLAAGAAVVVSNHVSPPGTGSQASLKTVIRLPKLPSNQLNTSASQSTPGNSAAPPSEGSSGGKKNKKSLRKLEQQQQAILSKQQELHNQALDEYDMDLIDNPHHRVKRPKIVTPTPPAKTSIASSLRGSSPSSLLMTVPGSEVPSADESEASSSDMGHHSVGGKTSPDSSSSHKIDDKGAEPMVVPEKASSYNIHPERCCSDVCHYCGMKFGIFDTPLHLSQLKNLEVQKLATDFASIKNNDCLCDKCFRYIDRTAKNKNKRAAGKSSEDQGKADSGAERTRTCLVRNCNREVIGTVSKKWLIRLKKKLSKKVTVNWDRITKGSAKSSFAVCNKHNTLVETFTKCGLCKRKLTVGGICGLGMSKDEVRELNEELQNDNIPSELYENVFVCKCCKTFCGIKKKSAEPDYLKNHKSHKAFYKDYRRKLHIHLGNGDEYSSDTPSPKKIHQVSQSDNPTKITIKTTTLDVGNERPSRKRKTKEFASPSSEARIHVATDYGDEEPAEGQQAATSAAGSKASETLVEKSDKPSGSGVGKCSVNIQFDPNTKKLWQDLHFPYGNYTSFFRHLILLEKYWRNGDIQLAEGASQKAAGYIKSVRNRIDAYEGRNKRSDADLSESTRPDLSIPSAPGGLHVPSNPDSEIEEVNDPDFVSSNASKKDQNDSTILKIPKIPMPGGSEGAASYNSLTVTPSSIPPSVSPSLPTKIRVRTDLMHLGLMANEPNLMEQRKEQNKSSSSQQAAIVSPRKEGFNIADLMASTPSSTSVTASTPSSISSMKSQQQMSLLQILNDPPVARKRDHSGSQKVGSGPILGNTSLICSSSGTTTVTSIVTASGTTTSSSSKSGKSSQSSNSQLFKSSDSGSSAIPLTFNNSIAEVLAATARAKSKQAEYLSGKPEITITAKSKSSSRPSSTFSATNSSAPVWNSTAANEASAAAVAAMAAAVSAASSPMKNNSHGSSSSLMKSASPSGGLSLQKLQKASSAASGSGSISNSGVSNIHPLMDMSKLLQTQKPGLPPHIVAQSTLPHALGANPGVSQGVCIPPSPKQARIAPKPGPMPSQVRPVQLNKSTTSGSASSSSSIANANANANAQAQAQAQAAVAALAAAAAMPQGIQTVNKKSLNTVLDRLSGLKGSPQSAFTGTDKRSSSSSGSMGGQSMSKSASGSSLMQQLNAPPMNKSSSTATRTTNSTSGSSSSAVARNNAAAASALQQASNAQLAAQLAGLNQQASMFGFGGQMVGQPMVQYPSWGGNLSTQQQAAQAALLMATAGMPGMQGMQGMNSVQAAAMQELMKMSLQQQAAGSSSANSAVAAMQAAANAASASNASPRIRAPPPLTQMGRLPHNKPKND